MTEATRLPGLSGWWRFVELDGVWRTEVLVDLSQPFSFTRASNVEYEGCYMLWATPSTSIDLGGWTEREVRELIESVGEKFPPAPQRIGPCKKS